MRKRWRYVWISLLVIGICSLHPVSAATLPGFLGQRWVENAQQPLLDPPQLLSPIAQLPDQPLDPAKGLYESGQFAAALTQLHQSLQLYQNQGDRLRQGLTLSNLALVYQQLGQWTEANQSIAESLRLLDLELLNRELPPALLASLRQVRAQALMIQGRLQLAIGQAEPALTSWEQATAAYEQLGDQIGIWQSRLNQTQALQALGFYRRAIEQLTALSQDSLEPPPSLVKAALLRSLGDALQVTGDLDQARQALAQALQVLTAVSSPNSPASAPPSGLPGLPDLPGLPGLSEAMAATHLSLANLNRLEAISQLSLSTLSPEAAIQVLKKTQPSRTLAEAALQQRQTIAALRFFQQMETAIQFCQRAQQEAIEPTTKIQVQLNQLNLLVELQRWQAAAPMMASLRSQLETVPASHTRIEQQINLALSWGKWAQAQTLTRSAAPATSPDARTQLLITAIQQAEGLGDFRMQSFGLGSLGAGYEQTQNWAAAKSATQQALMIAQSIQAADLSYRWQWQLGRLLLQQGNRADAIVAYREAVQSLQTLRNDLVAINRDVQFSFQAQIEPLYRELVALLLSTDGGAPPAAERLVQARTVISGLQIAELDNFFREACLEPNIEIDQVIDQANVPAAVFYTIMLPDRLEVILKLPEQDLLHYTTRISQTEVEAAVDEFLAEVKRPYPSARLRVLSQQIYDWLIRPADGALSQQPVETLVFLLDASLRNLPISALHDGEQFLIQKYGIALAPGLQLTDPQPLQKRRFKVLVAGLSEGRANFAPLNFVRAEIADIESELPSKVLLNQSFTPENLQQQLDGTAFSVVHIATHGQFSSNATETFILAWDRPIRVLELSNLLRTETLDRPNPIELLVLSACRTAVGDRRATLGMAGVAVRAGARSTIASLWNLDDDSGAALMNEFYQALVQVPLSKAEALRQAQLSLLENPRYAAPRFWAPYVLLGNWL